MVIVGSDGSFYCGLVGNSDVSGSYQLIIRPTLRKVDKICEWCRHDLSENSHGIDQNDFDGTRYVGSCTYCKYCRNRTNRGIKKK